MQELTYEETALVSGGTSTGVAVVGGLVGGTAIGVDAGITFSEGVGALASYGLIGAEVGAWAGPVGLVIGIGGGIVTYYVLKTYF